MSDLEAMDKDLASLVAAEKSFAPSPPADVRVAVLAALEIKIAALPVSGGGGGGSNPSASSAPTDPSPATPSSSSLARLFASHPLGTLFGALAVGAIVGAGAMHISRPPPQVIYVDRAIPGPTVSVLEIIPEAPSVIPTSSATSSSSNVLHVHAPPAEPSIDARGLAAERMLLDTARTALANGEPEQTMAAVDRHAQLYPHGVLAEEREALAVKALAALGKNVEARARGQKFRDQYPRSVALPSVNATLAGLPE